MIDTYKPSKPLRYLFILSNETEKVIIPCDIDELKLILKNNPDDVILEQWPGGSHGPYYPMGRYEGIIVLDLQGQDPAHPMSKEEIASI